MFFLWFWLVDLGGIFSFVFNKECFLLFGPFIILYSYRNSYFNINETLPGKVAGKLITTLLNKVVINGIIEWMYESFSMELHTAKCVNNALHRSQWF